MEEVPAVPDSERIRFDETPAGLLDPLPDALPDLPQSPPEAAAADDL
jgi:hypothetical protein